MYVWIILTILIIVIIIYLLSPSKETFSINYLSEETKQKPPEEIKQEETNENCIKYENINQCMTACTENKICNGFYIDSPGSCCMISTPSFDQVFNQNNQRRRQVTQDELDYREELTKNKIVFNYIGQQPAFQGYTPMTDVPLDNEILSSLGHPVGNHVYRSEIDRDQCKSFCPKCVFGRCPDHYRCVNMFADPRYNNSCLITNSDTYDDSPKIPNLNLTYL